ncbi:MAG: hypothetical protein VKJ86_07250 [Synechococcus sp.]|nr:hypothetical protein [Synechococcus sp.]
MTQRTLGKALMFGTMILMGSGFSANAAPQPISGPLPLGCPTNLPPDHCWMRTAPSEPLTPGVLTGILPPTQGKPQPQNCPNGWQTRPQEVNFQLGPCLPGTIASPLPSSQQAQPKPLSCPDGWQPRPQEVNFQLGPCLPGTVVTPNNQPQPGLLLPAVQQVRLGVPR